MAQSIRFNNITIYRPGSDIRPRSVEWSKTYKLLRLLYQLEVITRDQMWDTLERIYP